MDYETNIIDYNQQNARVHVFMLFGDYSKFCCVILPRKHWKIIGSIPNYRAKSNVLNWVATQTFFKLKKPHFKEFLFSLPLRLPIIFNNSQRYMVQTSKQIIPSCR